MAELPKDKSKVSSAFCFSKFCTVRRNFYEMEFSERCNVKPPRDQSPLGGLFKSKKQSRDEGYEVRQYLSVFAAQGAVF
jgi:hypothetical protein